MNVISKLPDEVNRCLYVGHNPGVTELINDLGVRLDNLPTRRRYASNFISTPGQISLPREQLSLAETGERIMISNY
jgi:phosphohistidine phosphatase